MAAATPGAKQRMERIYEPNPKHKLGASGDGPPRWFPDSATLCPSEIDMQLAQTLLSNAIEGKDDAHPDKKALYTIHEGAFFKAYKHNDDGDESEDGDETWHGYPVLPCDVPQQIPSRILRQFRDAGLLTNASYKKLLGSAR